MRRLFAFALSIAVAGIAAAQQSLPDPTRPANVAAESAPAAGGSNRLQSVLLPKHGKPLAVIDGRSVTIGDKVGDAQVTQITESAVTLNGPEGSQTLKMLPDVEKKPSASPKPPVKRGKGRPEQIRGGMQ